MSLTMPVPDGGVSLREWSAARPETLRAPARPARVRLLILTADFAAGDVAEVIRAAAPLLQRDGFEVIVGALGPWGPLAEALVESGVRAVAFGARHPLDPRAAGRMLSLLRRERIQIVHAYRYVPNMTARVLGRLADVPVIVASHPEADPTLGPARRLLERLLAPLGDAVIAGCESARRFALDRLGLPAGLLRTLPGAVTDRSDPGPQAAARREALRREFGAGPHDLLIGTSGELEEPRRGMSVFLAAAGLLARQRSEVRFVIVGDGRDRARLEARAAEEGVSHRTFFAGDRRDLHETLGAFDLCVLPSLQDGLAVTALLAMSAGTPLVASRVGGVPEVVVDGETGILVPPGDARALAGACAALLQNRDRAGRLAAAARERSRERFSAGRLARDSAALYRGLLARAGARPHPGALPPWRQA